MSITTFVKGSAFIVAAFIAALLPIKLYHLPSLPWWVVFLPAILWIAPWLFTAAILWFYERRGE